MKIINKFQGSFRWVSNFWPCKVWYDGMWYSSIEHAYQAAKTLDLRWRKRIQAAPTPGDAKRLGKRVPLRPDWDDIKESIMKDLVFKKFYWDKELRSLLLGTEGVYLEEGNTWGDTFWGVDLRTGKGRNRLGKILMWVREELKVNN